MAVIDNGPSRFGDFSERNGAKKDLIKPDLENTDSQNEVNMNKRLYRELKTEGKIYKVKNPEGSNFISCPTCANKMLRQWDSETGPVALCYDCGQMFYSFTGEIIGKLSGEPQSWGSQAIGSIALLKSEFKTKNKYNEFAQYLKKRQLRLGLFNKKQTDKLSDEEMVKCYQECGHCGENLYTDEQLEECLKRCSSPKETLDFIAKRLDYHSIDQYLEDKEYVPLEYDEKTWRCEKDKSILISLEIRQHVANIVAKEFYDWLMSCGEIVVNHDDDPPWDCSGELVVVEVSAVEKLREYDTLAEWWDEARTGESYPSYTSGCGFLHETYRDVVESLVSDTLDKIWKKEAPEEVYEKKMELMELIGKMTTHEAFERHR